ncbi:uncharacterized protein LOC125831436 [Solanum verrucosum]|uniref:uncharacterized protein LOC125831436 n=1 Tax=Solanum verrucosum TaxID=315347 RepID=UPI0020CFEECA|nr:uncharacterized protein LOC125831436 [Solanum verrucosum]
MDGIGPIEPATSNGHRFILVAINYFTKWVEAASYKSVTKKVVADFVPNNLICYRTTISTSVGATPYLLVYGTELTLINEKRMVVACHGQLYRQRMIRAFHKKVRARMFEVGQLVLKRIFPHQDEYKGKFSPNWQGPYMVHKVLSRGALVLSEMDGAEWPKPINSDSIKRYTREVSVYKLTSGSVSSSIQ